MGAGASKINTQNDLLQEVNLTASKYILNQNFQDLINLKNKDYCKNLVILTSKIINNNLNKQQITYLAQYQTGDKIIYKLGDEDVLYFNNSEIKKIDEQNSIKKNRMCIGISAFYIKINYIFASIFTTLKPIALLNISNTTTNSDNSNDTDNSNDNQTEEIDRDNSNDIDNINDTDNQSEEIDRDNSNDNQSQEIDTDNSTDNQSQEIDTPISDTLFKNYKSENSTLNVPMSLFKGGSPPENPISSTKTPPPPNPFSTTESPHEPSPPSNPFSTTESPPEPSPPSNPFSTTEPPPEPLSPSNPFSTTEPSPPSNPFSTTESPPEPSLPSNPFSTTEPSLPSNPFSTTEPSSPSNPFSTTESPPEKDSSYYDIQSAKNISNQNTNKIILGFITVNSLCGKRIANLININSNFNIDNFDIDKYDLDMSKEISINPTICDYNTNFQDEIGIPEFEKLYYDLFNFKLGEFKNMSKNAKEDYDNDLLNFYNTFTGSELTNVSQLSKLNPPVNKFSDIKIDYDNILKNTCVNYDHKKNNISGRSRDFREYGLRLQTMIKNTKLNQDKLLDILNQIFYIKRNKYPLLVTLNKNLNNQSLDKLVVETRLLIKNMYIQCDKDYRSVLKIFKIIVDTVKLNTVSKQQEQINTFESQSELEPDDQPESQSELEPEAEPDSETEPDAEPKPEAQTEDQPEAEPEAEPEAQTEDQPKSQSEVDPEAQTEDQSGTLDKTIKKSSHGTGGKKSKNKKSKRGKNKKSKRSKK